ncbi:uncharacterized protein LOC116418301 isoform X4 [Nasonia vitripennis]|uniref:DUF4806 domain-containing protein n=2 Tax=Nasonia vitripennis TaxID=7425 RepID=A0A7M7QPQ0_NASVI|nr:uncharacterized protein LOC116416115 isoform X4 [Nasonia vitripennis]XP_032452745.1 uncharacterized protein LOC116416181 isoform X4 [Nasonia vitripennis]XP_032456394.1 uncharacterized protein LOC116417562 isoform X4 [Nasonia vitripennis]XP_032456520.1 uncharacterized protein LOC116417564 isoform X4 [Nasonia vitripennis]XP_032456618.1 uncharacterized protein LOC116416188 isoform X4 [Nasonia vitripennis]XP_032457487.1 uncharacterized protein LOC116416547 isoform X4 [Nasonia vitripennis]XP_03
MPTDCRVGSSLPTKMDDENCFNDQGTWYVVVFAENGEEKESVEAIPDFWILNNGEDAMWPPWTNDRKTIRAIASRKSPEDSWSICKLKKVYRDSVCDTYGEAAKKAEFAEDTSDLNGEYEKLVDPKNRKNLKRRALESSDDNGDDELETSSRKNIKQDEISTPFSTIASLHDVPTPPKQMLIDTQQKDNVEDIKQEEDNAHEPAQESDEDEQESKKQDAEVDKKANESEKQGHVGAGVHNFLSALDAVSEEDDMSQAAHDDTGPSNKPTEQSAGSNSDIESNVDHNENSRKKKKWTVPKKNNGTLIFPITPSKEFQSHLVKVKKIQQSNVNIEKLKLSISDRKNESTDRGSTASSARDNVNLKNPAPITSASTIINDDVQAPKGNNEGDKQDYATLGVGGFSSALDVLSNDPNLSKNQSTFSDVNDGQEVDFSEDEQRKDYSSRYSLNQRKKQSSGSNLKKKNANGNPVPRTSASTTISKDSNTNSKEKTPSKKIAAFDKSGILTVAQINSLSDRDLIVHSILLMQTILTNQIRKKVNEGTKTTRFEEKTNELFDIGILIKEKFPLRSKAQFDVFNNHLKTDNEFRMRFKKYFESLGENDGAAIARNILRLIITDNVGVLYSLKGQLEKERFDDKPFYHILEAAAMKCTVKNKVKDIRTAVGNWLKSSKGRIDARLESEAKKREQEKNENLENKGKNERKSRKRSKVDPILSEDDSYDEEDS